VRLEDQQLVLDTNVLLHLLRGKAAAERLEREYKISARSPRAIISVVTKGELKALGYKFDWGSKQHERRDAMLTVLPAADISHRAIWHAYAELDHSSARVWIKMGKNDLWIAATVRVTEGVLLTTDGDFDHLAPSEVRVERIDEEWLRSRS
jgi:predicted nucleic acid-binding protein